MPVIRFEVLGKPATAGSKRVFPFKRKDESLGVRVTHDNVHFEDWRQQVAGQAMAARGNCWFDGPVSLAVWFWFPRPKGHYGTGRNIDKLKPSAPEYPAVKPDLSKLVRALEDSLKGILWRDDAQVIVLSASKMYGSDYRAVVAVSDKVYP